MSIDNEILRQGELDKKQKDNLEERAFPIEYFDRWGRVPRVTDSSPSYVTTKGSGSGKVYTTGAKGN